MIRIVFTNIYYLKRRKNKGRISRSTRYPKGTVLANINRLVALTYFLQPKKNSPSIFQGTVGVTAPETDTKSSNPPSFPLPPSYPFTLPPLSIFPYQPFAQTLPPVVGIYMIRDTSCVESNTLCCSDIGVVQILGIVREIFAF